MKFRTEIPVFSYPFQIDYHSKIYGMGSCFVDNMKERFTYYQFRNLINDFGVIFNPASINSLVKRIVREKFFTENDIFFHENTWKSFELHSEMNHPDKNRMLFQANHKLRENKKFIQQANLVIFTLGTAWVYRHKSSGKIVANCHKVKAGEFEKILLSPAEMYNELQSLTELIFTANSNAKILFSVSPVRHLKDGFVENQQSKAHLLSAVHSLTDNKRIMYFPSYEIMMDDLRDYRFYQPDMLHPNETAITYIWEKFRDSLLTTQSIQISKQVEKIRKSLQHKPFNPNSKEHQAFLEKINRQIHALQKRFAWMRFDV